MVLVDTSVFVRHFRGRKDATFDRLILNDEVFLSSYVRLELVQGVRRAESKQLDYVLGGLSPLELHPDLFQEAEEILKKLKGTGIIMGIVDLLLAAEANLIKCPVYSFDTIFEKLSALRLVAIL